MNKVPGGNAFDMENETNNGQKWLLADDDELDILKKDEEMKPFELKILFKVSNYFTNTSQK